MNLHFDTRSYMIGQTHHRCVKWNGIWICRFFKHRQLGKRKILIQLRIKLIAHSQYFQKDYTRGKMTWIYSVSGIEYEFDWNGRYQTANDD